MTLRRIKCELCTVKIPKYQPNLFCSICKSIKHLKCQGLSKSDVKAMIGDGFEWTCYQCISQILPVAACSSTTHKSPKFKQQCYSCKGYSYSPNNVRICEWCNNKVHLKCWRGELGCATCCQSMIPGADVHNFELLGDYNYKNNFTFNPYHYSHLTMQLGDLIDNEASSEMWHDVSEFLVNCTYKQPSPNNEPKELELDILSLNIQTLNSKIGSLRENLANIEKHDIICLQETNCIVDKLPNGINDLLLEGFHEPQVTKPNRPSGRGGGLAIYVNKRVCDDTNIESLNINPEPENTSGEFQFIKIKECKGTNKTVIIGNVYRSPKRKPDSFNSLFDSVLQKLNRNAKKLIYIVGDFNQDLIRYDQDVNSQNLVDYASNHGFIQIVSRPTRITDHSATLLDHVYTNSLDNTISCNIITHDISDHLAIHTKIALDTSKKNTFQSRNVNNNRQNTDYRVFNEANNAIFQRLIDDETWDEIEDDMDAQTQYDTFSDIYMKHYNEAYPLKSQRVRRKNERLNPKPWILPWLEEACARKQAFYHLFVKDPTPEKKKLYDKWNNFCIIHCEKARIKYYKKYFDDYKDNSKKQWLMINQLLNRGNKNKSIRKLIDDKGTVVNTPSAIAEKFNEYFANVASNLKESTSHSVGSNPNTFDDFLHEPVVGSMYLRPTDSGEVHQIIKNFKNKSTLDCKISVLKIANTNFNFTDALSKVINKSFKEGHFPKQLKVARVVPIHKGGAKTDVSNYRPISLLKSFSKVYEKIMHNRILNFMEENGSLYDNQYGFRPGRSCEHAILNAQNVLLNSLNQKKVSLLLLIDYSKAFDMVDHKILLRKLEHYGIRGTVLAWMKSYLENRTQYVTIDSTDSSEKHMKYGVPQGSILGPLLFIIYINDLPQIHPLAHFILYADDANIILTANSVEEIYEQLTQLSEILLKWVDCNGLALNLKKTYYMLFSRSRVDLPNSLIISNIVIERKTEVRFLGVIIDEKLTWTSHVKALQSKMCRYIGVMYKIKKYLPLKARLQIYHSFIQSHINFCSLVWGFSAKSNIDSLFSKQKKGIRAVVPGFINYKYKDGELPGHTKSFFKEYNILTIQGIIALNALLFMHKVRNFPRSLPKSIVDTIPDNSPLPDSTHETCEPWLMTYNSIHFRSSLFYKGPTLAIIPEIVQLTSPSSLLKIKIYRDNVKRFLLDYQSSGEENEWLPLNHILNNIPGLRKSERLRNGRPV